jgi:hypothetical protein
MDKGYGMEKLSSLLEKKADADQIPLKKEKKSNQSI